MLKKWLFTATLLAGGFCYAVVTGEETPAEGAEVEETQEEVTQAPAEVVLIQKRFNNKDLCPKIEDIKSWKKILKIKKELGFKIVHLTMYGENINKIQSQIIKENQIFVVVGAEKVPREIYNVADYNVAVGSQPHSEISALAVLLDRVQKGSQFQLNFDNPKKKIIPSAKGKKVILP